MKIVIDIPEIPTNDKQRWALANGTPYPHGEWERTDNRWGAGAWRCTHCNSYYDIDTNYCPTCGASMFKKEGETNE